MKHTPGPWRAVLRGGKSTFASIKPVSDPDGLITTMFVESDEEIANLKLMTSAPDLLRVAHIALTLAVASNACDGLIDDIKNVIANAEGRKP